MQAHNVKNSLVDEEAGVTYHVMAYRALRREELLRCVRIYLRNRRSKKKLKPGTEITIVTVIH
jgi:hypothetical protein